METAIDALTHHRMVRPGKIEVVPCPAISEADPRYIIDAELCTECVEEGGSRCVPVCPVECIDALA